MSRALPRSALLAPLLALVVACDRHGPAVVPPLRLVFTSSPITLDPHLQDEVTTASVLGNLYDGLTAFDGDSRVIPALAQRWENPDDLTWRFHLRRGVHFQNGATLNAKDVVFSLHRAVTHPRSRAAHYLVAVRDSRAVDDSTVEIRTSRPYPILLHKLAFIMIVPRTTGDEITHPNGTGAYRLVRQWGTDSLELAAFSEYWGDPPAEPHVKLYFVDDASRRVAMLLDGRADLITYMPIQEIAAVDSAACCRVISRAGLVVAYLGMRMDVPPFSDARVRRAMELALDRDQLVKALFGGRGRAVGQLVSPQVFGYAPDLEPGQRDLVQARALLNSAGYGRGLDVALEYPPARGEQVEMLRDQLAEAGIRVTPTQRTWSEFTARRGRHEVQLFFAGLACLSGDASDLFDASLHSRQPAAGYGEGNFTGYANRAVDSLIERSESLFDMGLRRQLMEQVLRATAHDLPMVPLWTQHRLYGVRRGVAWTPRLSGATYAFDVRRTSAPR